MDVGALNFCVLLQIGTMQLMEIAPVSVYYLGLRPS